MKKSIRHILASLWAALILGGCADFGLSPPGPAAVVKDDGTTFIVDRTGKRWDVGHSSQYGFKASKYQFGLGPNAIRPIMLPTMLTPGQPGYPHDDDNFRVMGVVLGDLIRAYPIGPMSRHEVANEQFGQAHVAVAY